MGPALQGAEVALSVAPSTYTDPDDRPWAKAGDTVTVTFDVVDPSALDTALSSVALSGLELTPDTTGTIWTVTLDGSEGDGAKNLNARLVDTAGNALVVTRTALTRFDFTPPAGACFLAPNPANGTQTVTFAFTPTETLDGPPVLTSPDVTLDGLAFDGTRWTATVVAPPAVNTPYTVGIEATDLVGNTAGGTDVCPEADRTGEVFAVPPTADSVVLSVSGSNVFDDGSGVPVVGLNAVLTVNLTTDVMLNPEVTSVRLGDINMGTPSVDDNVWTWTRAIEPGDTDGLKNLTVTLVDVVGNSQSVDTGGQGVRVDLTPPVAASCVLTPNPANRDAVVDPATGLPREDGVRLELLLNEATAEPAVTPTTGDVTAASDGSGSSQLSWSIPILPNDVNTDTDYTLLVEATDRVGNTGVVCEPSGAMRLVLPTAEDVTLTVSGENTFIPPSGPPIVGRDGIVSVDITSSSPLDVDATIVQTGEIRLEHHDALTWQHQVSTGELNGVKDLSVTLVDIYGNAAPVTLPRTSIRVDTFPPTATCVLTPPVALAGENAILEVRPSEQLGDLTALLTTDAPDGAATLTPLPQSGINHRFEISGSAGQNINYEVVLAGEDLVGNAASSLCLPADRQGSLNGLLPQLSEPASVVVTDGAGAPTYNDTTGRPWARAGHTVTVTLTPDADTSLDEDATVVQLSGVPLSSVGPSTWAITLDGSEGDGSKNLEVTLRDEVGNRTSLLQPDAVRFDFTPPTASCVLSPVDANANDTITLQLFSDEPLAGVPAATANGDVGLTLVSSGPNNRSFTWEIDALVTGNDIPYVIRLTGADLVGNPQSGTSFCGLASRSGSIDNQPPSATATFSVSPRVSLPGEPDRAREGATLTLTLDVDEPLGLSTNATLGDVQLVVDGPGNAPQGTTPQTWRTTFTAELGPGFGHAEGLKRLVALLFDERGNQASPLTHVDVPEAQFVADFTAPEIVSALLLRTPFLATADDGSGTVLFTDNDPITGQAVRADLQVFTDETLDGTSPLTVVGPSSPSFTGGAPNGRRTAYQLSSFTGVAEGAYTFQVEVTDLVGNTAIRDLPDATMVVDRTGPTTSPDVDTPYRIVYHRAPWGRTQSDAPSFTVEGAADAARPGALLIAANPAGGLLGSGVSSGDGSFSLTLGSDVPDISLIEHDDAGNPGPMARVRDATWTATLRDKTPGNTSVNPHIFRAHDLLPDALFSPSVEPPGLPWSTVTEPPWRRIQAPPPSFADIAKPGQRQSHAMAYDSARGVTVLFGGDNALLPCGDSPERRCSDTWEWNGERWLQRFPATTPPGRNLHAMAYDTQRGVVVMYGGTSTEVGACGTPGSTRCSDTWEWDGVDWRPRTSQTQPPPLSNHQMAYDINRGVTVLVGGFEGASATLTNRVWEWDGQDWIGPISPPSGLVPRIGHAMAYDDFRSYVLIAGGSGNSGGLADAWSWNGSTFTARASLPDGPRSGHTLVYRPSTRRTLLFGGSAPGVCGIFGCDDIWEWTGSTWVLTEPADDEQPLGSRHAATFDVRRDTMVMFGGERGGTVRFDRTWEWDGEVWRERTRPPPPRRSGHAIAYDARAAAEFNNIVLFGGVGCGSFGSGVCSDTWTWDGVGWVEQTPVLTPPARSNHALSRRRSARVVLFGGRDATNTLLNDTWEWSYSSNIWYDRNPTSPTPPAREHHRMAYDRERRITVLFGGLSNSGPLLDTWEWDGSSWVQVNRTCIGFSCFFTTTPPARRSRHGMAYDRVREQVLVFGGLDDSGDLLGDTWLWDGNAGTWTQASPSVSPPARADHTLTYDQDREEVLLFGGTGAPGTCGSSATNNRCSDTWAWNGSSWRQIEPRPRPSERSLHRAAYDERRDQHVLFAGERGADFERLADTWTLQSDEPERPGHTFTVPFSRALVPDAEIQAVLVDWRGGATSTPGGASVDGHQLSVWDGLSWQTLVTSFSSTPSSPARTCRLIRTSASVPTVSGCFTATNASLLRRLFRFGPNQTATFAARPRDRIGFDRGEISTEDIAVTVRYRLP